MKLALFRCCGTSIFLKQYETSTDAVLKALDVDLVNIREFNCCGYPLKNFRHDAFLLSSARNLSLAEKAQLDIMTLCNCCYGSLRHVSRSLGEDDSKREEINGLLQKEGLRYAEGVQIRHVLDVLHSEIGLQAIQRKIARNLKGLKIALHHGCHLLRPREVTGFDTPGNPTRFKDLVEVTGATCVPWTSSLECCGSPLWGVDNELSMDLTEKKIQGAKEAGADFFCVACPFCQLQFDRVQRILAQRRGLEATLPSLLYTQLLGISLGIDEHALGITRNELDCRSVLNFGGPVPATQPG
jgi:heterodisulfide reductase subunit B